MVLDYMMGSSDLEHMPLTWVTTLLIPPPPLPPPPPLTPFTTIITYLAETSAFWPPSTSTSLSSFRTSPVHALAMQLQDVLAQQLSLLSVAVDLCHSIANHSLESVRSREDLGMRARRMLVELAELERVVREEPMFLPVSPEELAAVKVGIGTDHWYRCPNGHMYAIGDCGGAMQRGNCPECGQVVRGEHHRLVARNTLAD